MVNQKSILTVLLCAITSVNISCGDNDKSDRQDSPPGIKNVQYTAVAGMTYIGKNPQGYDEYKHRQTGVVLILIKSGQFNMGSNDGLENERPVHGVTLDSFLISKYEITQETWQKIMKTNPSETKGKQNPVENVEWTECQEFCIKTRLRLPSEAEWEYACRAGTYSKYYWGDKGNEEYMWYDPNTKGNTQPVGQKRPNNFGLYDMIGNVTEWCWDWYDENYYQHSPKSNPKGPDSGRYHSVRGASYEAELDGCHSSVRGDCKYGNRYVGFRVVASIK